MRNFILILSMLFVAFMLPLITFSQRPLEIDENFPEGKVGSVAKEFIEVINNQRDEVVFLNTNAIKQNTGVLSEQIYQLKELTGGIAFKGIFKSKRAGKNQLIIVAEDENYGLWRGISIKFNDQGTNKVEGIRFRSFPKPLPENEISESEMIEIIAKTIDKLEKRDLFSGTVLIAKGEEVLYEKAVGEASKRFHVANNLDTKFNIASLGKMFTAVAIMQLKEQNKLKLNDTISKYVDTTWLPNKILDQITIHHLLTHTSGLGNYFNEKFINAAKENYRTIDDFKPLLATDSLSFEPGKHFKYSNIGYLLLGVIVENAGNVDYETFIEEHIFKPAKMTNTGFYEMDHPVENLAIGYSKSGKSKYGWTNNIFEHVIKGGPAGGSYATVNDMLKFITALKNQVLLSAEGLEKLWTKDHNIRTGYAYGFEVRENENGRQIGHSGGFVGISAEVVHDLNKDYSSVVLSNYDSGSEISFVIRDLINQAKF